MLSVLHIGMLLTLAAPPGDSSLGERWTRQLGVASWHDREEASERLLGLGQQAIPALRRALASADPEVRRRARRLLDRLEWRPPGGLSDRLAAVMRHYGSLPERQRTTLLSDVVRELRSGAAPVLCQALRSDPSPTVRNTALRQLMTIDRKAAEVELRALAQTPTAASWAWASLGELLAGSGRTDEAIEAYVAAREAGAKDARVAESLARLYARKGDWPKARDLYAELVAADPENGNARLQLGRCHQMLGDRAKAEAAWRDVLRNKGDDPKAYIWLANAYEGIGARDRALDALRQGCKKHPQTFELLRRLASALAREKKLEEAIEYYERAQRATQSHYQRRALNVELTSMLRQGGILAGYLRRKGAELARLDRQIIALLRNAAERHLNAGRRADAHATLQKLANLYPDTTDGRWAIGKLRGLGEPE